jgi:hypothetical protein
MRNVIVYSFDNSLEKLIKRKRIIPYQVNPGDRFMKGKWYYDMFFGSLFKVIDVKYKSGNILEYAITKSDEGYSSYISTPLSPYEDYIIDHDINNIAEQDIINTEKSYTGAEIRYWFFINNITCFDPKYRYFWAYVDTYSNNRVSDKQKYFLYAAIRNGVYTHCRVVKDCSKNKKLTQKDIDDINEFMKEQKSKDMYNVKRYHEGIINESTSEEETIKKVE